MKLLLLLLVPAVAMAADIHADFVAKAKARLEHKLNDPESAKYRDLYIGQDTDGSPVLCGELNARNANGGYAGFQAFFAKPDGDAYWAGVPREFLTIRNVNPDYTAREKDKCKSRVKPVD